MTIIIALVGGFITSIPFGLVDFTALKEAAWIGVPSFTLPQFSWKAIALIALNDMFQERKKDDITDPAAFRKYFAAHTADGREVNDLVTPQLRDLVQKLEASSGSAKLCGLILRDGDLTLALNTRYVFAGVPEELDLRDIDGIRKWFTASLTGMGNLLDLITESPALTGAAE